MPRAAEVAAAIGLLRYFLRPIPRKRRADRERGMRFSRYQAIEEFGIAGRRTLGERTRLYRLSDFKGATVLDLGCNIGQMMYQAMRWEAKEIVGVEINRR